MTDVEQDNSATSMLADSALGVIANKSVSTYELLRVAIRTAPVILYHLLAGNYNNYMDVIEGKEKMHDSIDCLKTYYFFKQLLDKESMAHFARYGCLSIVKYLHENVTSDYYKALIAAVTNEQVEIVEFLLSVKDHAGVKGEISELEIATIAASYDKVKMLKYAIEKYPESSIEDALDEAIKYDCMQVIEFILDNKLASVPPNAMLLAAEQGNVELMIMLEKYYQLEIDSTVVKIVIAFGHLELFMWLVANYPVDIDDSLQCAYRYDQYELANEIEKMTL